MDMQSFADVQRAVANMRISRDMAAAANDTGLTRAIQDKMDGLIERLVALNTDPHTTAADIRYFENYG